MMRHGRSETLRPEPTERSGGRARSSRPARTGVVDTQILNMGTVDISGNRSTNWFITSDVEGEAGQSADKTSIEIKLKARPVTACELES